MRNEIFFGILESPPFIVNPLLFAFFVHSKNLRFSHECESKMPKKKKKKRRKGCSLGFGRQKQRRRKPHEHKKQKDQNQNFEECKPHNKPATSANSTNLVTNLEGNVLKFHFFFGFLAALLLLFLLFLHVNVFNFNRQRCFFGRPKGQR